MPAAPDDFSLALGGPLYQLYLRSRLVRPPIELLNRRIVALMLITWLPLAVLSSASGNLVSGVEVSFLTDLEAQCRFLVSLPLLIAAEVLVHRRVQVTVRQFLERRLIAPEDQRRFDEAVASSMRLRNSTLLEVLMLALALTGGYWLQQEHGAIYVSSWYHAEPGTDKLTAAGYWYVFISLPIFRFLLLRWYFRLLVWYRFLWKVSRIPLRLNALHPDRAAGLGFLNDSAMAFVPVFVAQTVLVAGAIGDQIWHQGASLLQFKMEIAAALAVLVLLVFAPLTFFILQLEQARRAGMREYGALASGYVNHFRKKWTHSDESGGESILGTSDIQSLADLGNSFEVVVEMRFLPFSRRAVLGVAAVLALPLLPLLLTIVPLDEAIDRLIDLLM